MNNANAATTLIPHSLLSLSICYQENSKNTRTKALASTASVTRSVLVSYLRIAGIAHNTQCTYGLMCRCWSLLYGSRA